MAKCKSLDLDVVGGSSTQVIGRWLTGQKTAYVDHFEAQFIYYNGKNVKWIYDSVQNVPTTQRSTKPGKGEFWHAIYTCPDPSDERATSIKFRVRAKAKQYDEHYKDSKGNDKTRKKYRFGGSTGYDDWVMSKEITNPRVSAEKKAAAAAPPVPDAPTARVLSAAELAISGKSVSSGSSMVAVTASALDTELDAAIEVGFQSLDGAGGERASGVACAIPKGGGTAYFTSANGAILRFRARSRNESSGKASGYGQWGDLLHLPPLPVSSVRTAALSDSSIRVTWANAGASGDGAEVEWCADSAFSPGSTESASASGADACEYTITGLDASESNTWHVRVRRTQGDMRSEWARAGQSTIGSVPDAPTTYATAGSVPVDAAVRLSWTHNNADNSPQESAIVELEVDGASSFILVSSSASSVEVVPSGRGAVDGSTVRWRVKTSGATGESGPFSGWRSFTAYTQPELHVGAVDGDGNHVSGGDGLAALPLTVTCSASNTNAQVVAWSARLEAASDFERTAPDGAAEQVAAGTAVWRGSGDGPSVEFSIGPDAGIASGAAFELAVAASFSNGLRADASIAFEAEWDASVPPPDARAASSDGLTASIWPVCERLGADGEHVPVRGMFYDEAGLWQAYELQGGVTLSVYRIDAFGEAQLVADGVANDGKAVVNDPHPSFGDCTYRVVATDGSTGARDYTDVMCHVDNDAIVVQWDESWDADEDGAIAYTGGILELPGNIRQSNSTEPDVALVELFGESHPVSHYGTQVNAKGQWRAGFALAAEPEAMRSLRRLQGLLSDCYVREPSGIGYYANVRAGYEVESGVVSVSLSVTRVKHDGGDAL